MAEEQKATEEKAQTVAAEQEKAVETTQSTAAEIDYAAEFEALLAENTKLAADRDNYRKGMLSAKGKLKSEVNEESETLDEDQKLDMLLDRKLAEREDRVKKQREAELAKQLIKQNRELKIALANRSQISTGGSTSSSKETSQVGDSYWSKDQLEYFKKRGLDPNKVKENLESKKV